jgi:hypothetical protein
MTRITLHEAADIISTCAALIIDNVVTYPSMSNLEDKPDNEWLCLSWTDGDDRDFIVKFNEGENDEVMISGPYMYLIDNEGDEVQLTILGVKILD